jgi:hypothetical protein
VFQAVLRDSLDFVGDDVADMLDVHQNDDLSAKEDFGNTYPIMANVFTPRLALAALKRLRECLDRPEIYYLNDCHYLLLYETLECFVDIHNDSVAVSRTKKDRRESSFIDPFHIEFIDFDELVDLFFFDIDFLKPAEAMLNMPPEFKQTFNPEAFAISQGMMPHPEELELKLDRIEDPGLYKISAPEYFGPSSKIYPDYDYYEKNHPDK